MKFGFSNSEIQSRRKPATITAQCTYDGCGFNVYDNDVKRVVETILTHCRTSHPENHVLIDDGVYADA